MSDYNSQSIQKLSGIEHIRSRSSMYIPNKGTEGLHHILWEVIDNSVDEYLAKHCTRIRIVVDTKRNIVTVEDNGRGVPVEIHPQTGKPTLESIFTETLMGGKFGGGKNGVSSYSISGGLHGVGAKATCALSDKMFAWSTRKGKVYKVGYSQGKVRSSMKVVGKVKKGVSGTKIAFHPDPEIFGKTKFNPKLISERLEAVAFLCPGLQMWFKVDDNKPLNLTSEEGLSGLLKDSLADKEEPAFENPLSFSVHDEDSGEGIEVSMWWTSGDGEKWLTYVNMIPVPDGGTHVTGAKSAITREMKKLCSKAGVVGDDFRDGLRVACHVKLREPQFEGQTKNRLNNPEMSKVADHLFSSKIRNFLVKNSAVAKKLINRAVEMAKARAAYKATRKIATQTAYAKDPNSRRGLPDRLTTAMGCKPGERELFLVEGDSAGGSAVQGRDRKNQEILPLRGKLPNTASITDPVKLAKIFAHRDIDNIIRSVGAGHDVDKHHESCDPTKSRIGKIILLTDADADGGHIDALLLIFLLRFMLPVVEAGMVWVARPPLFTAKWGSGRVYGDSREEVIKLAADKGIKNVQISRFKGLGEMNPNQLAETSMDPASRRLIQISADKQSVEVVMNLMGADVSARKKVLGLLN